MSNLVQFSHGILVLQSDGKTRVTEPQADSDPHVDLLINPIAVALAASEASAALNTDPVDSLALSTADLGVSTETFAALSTTEVEMLLTSEISTLTTADLPALSTVEAPALSTDEAPALSTAKVPELKTTVTKKKKV